MFVGRYHARLVAKQSTAELFRKADKARRRVGTTQEYLDYTSRWLGELLYSERCYSKK